MKSKFLIKCLLLAPLLFLFSGCFETLEEQVERSTKELTSAANGINANASNAIAILGDLKKDYPSSIKSLINNDLDRLVKTAEYGLGTTAQCQTDFLSNRIKAGIKNTIIKLQNLVREKKHQPLLPLMKFPPSFCNCTPEQIDLNEDNIKPLKIYGYDFEDYHNMHLVATNLDGTNKDISSVLARPTDYLLTVRTDDTSYFSGYNKVEFYYNKQSIYTMLIIPKTPEICQEEDFTATPTPQLLEIGSYNCGRGGDNEFGGKAYMDCVGKLRLSPDQKTIICHISLHADEKDGDTHGCWEKDYNLYTAKNGYLIKTILTPTTYHFNYLDDDHDDDNFGGEGFIQSATFRGDHKGDDVGQYTGATLQLSNLTVTLIKSGSNCVPKDAYVANHAAEINSTDISNAIKEISKSQADIIKSIDLQKK